MDPEIILDIELEMETADEISLDVDDDGAVEIEFDDTGQGDNLQEKTHITPTQESQTITANAPFTGLSAVQIDPIPANYGLITWNGSTLTVS